MSPLPSSRQTGLVHRLRNHRILDPIRGQGLKALALKGSVWTVAGFGTQKALQLASNLILTRLLFPEAFGLMALVSICMVGLAMFSDVGIRASIIQNKRGEEPAFLNTAWTIQVIRGFILFLVACLIAYPASLIYDQPLLFPLICAAGTTAVIAGFQSTAVITANRNLRLGRLILIQLLGQIITILTTITLAWIYQSVWALAIGMIFGILTSTFLGHMLLASHPHKLFIDKKDFRTIFHFGRWIFLATLITFIGGQGLIAIQGVLVSVDTLAFIYIAGMFAMVATDLTLRLLNTIVFPALSKIVREEPERVPIVLSRIRNRLLAVTLPAFIILSLSSSLIIDTLYDERYAIAANYLAILAINGAIDVLPMVYQMPFLARGDSRTHFILMSAFMVLRITGLLIGFYIADVEGMLMGLGVGTLFGFFLVAVIAKREGWLSIKTDFLAIGSILIGAGISFNIGGFW